MAKFKPQYRRLLHIDRLIREGAYPNCSSLAKTWETSTRTMQRDIDYIKYELDAPLEYDPVRRGFYYSDPSWFLPSVLLSEGELLALLIGREAMAMYQGTPVADQLRRMYAKLEEMLPDKVSIGPELIEGRMSFFGAPARKLDPEVWQSVLRALLHGRVLEITYKSPAATTPKTHVVHPYHVVNLEGEWYLLGRNERWEGVSQYAMPRILAARVQDHGFERPADFDPAALLGNRFRRYLHHGKPPRKKVLVRLLVDPALATYISEKSWHPEQKIKARKGGAIELHIPVIDTLDVESWILSLGEHVAVLAPETLRATIRRRHLAAARKPG